MSTVSKVLNGYPDVAEETRERVMRSVEELHFSRNRAARNVRTGRTQAVSVMTPMIGTDFYDRLITAIDRELAAHEYDAALFPLLSEQRLQRYRSPDALPYHADGVILASLNPDALFLDARLPAPLPAVLVDAFHADYDTVTLDNRLGAGLATAHLLDVEAPTFALMVERFREGPFSSGVFVERHKGFVGAVRDSGVHEVADRVLEVAFSESGGRDGLRRILTATAPPLNVFASCDVIARGVIAEAHDVGLQVGRDIRVVGFDDQPWAGEIGLSTVHQPVEEMARLATELIFERLRDPSRPPEHVELEPRLVSRASTEGG